MAKTLRITSQPYPRITDEDDPFYGFLDEERLASHSKRISYEELKQIIRDAITHANKKSGRAILNIPEDITKKELQQLYEKIGKELFLYFAKYCGDPAATAHDCYKRHFSVVAKEQFRNRTLQKERMNSGWRYQFIAKDAAILSGRFVAVSDIGTSEADFNAVIKEKSSSHAVNIYVSVKNRTNTMGGQDWPKAIRAMEEVARHDKNRSGPYLCVFGIAMEKGARSIKAESKNKIPYSFNTEIWLSDFFWPFFSNFKYEEIIKAVLEVLIEQEEKSTFDVEIPPEIIDAFGKICNKYKLLDGKGCFNDAYRLVELFCGKIK